MSPARHLVLLAGLLVACDEARPSAGPGFDARGPRDAGVVVRDAAPDGRMAAEPAPGARRIAGPAARAIWSEGLVAWRDAASLRVLERPDDPSETPRALSERAVMVSSRHGVLLFGEGSAGGGFQGSILAWRRGLASPKLVAERARGRYFDGFQEGFWVPQAASPDGRFAAALGNNVDTTDDAMLVALDDTAPPRAVARGLLGSSYMGGNALPDLAFSADGAFLLVGSGDLTLDGHRAVAAYPTAGDATGFHVGPIEVGEPILVCPTGAQVALLAPTGDLVVHDLAPSTTRVLGRARLVAGYSPDGAQLLYQAPEASWSFLALHTAAADGRTPPSLVTNTSVLAADLPRWSRDGHDVLWASDRGPRGSDLILGGPGREVVLSALGSTLGREALSPDGLALVWYEAPSAESGNAPTGTLVAARRDAPSEPRALGPQVSYHAWLDGRRLLYAAYSDAVSTADLVLVDLATGSPPLTVQRNIAIDWYREQPFDVVAGHVVYRLAQGQPNDGLYVQRLPSI